MLGSSSSQIYDLESWPPQLRCDFQKAGNSSGWGLLSQCISLRSGLSHQCNNEAVNSRTTAKNLIFTPVWIRLEFYVLALKLQSPGNLDVF